MRKILIFIVLLSTIIVNAQEDKTITLTVSGTGKTLELAKTNALRSAIEQAFGAFISSKTELLNDNLISDQITSVANGNIQSFDILDKFQLLDNNWSATLKVVVSVNKLISFVESKGITIEIKGGLFALNIKQQILNEQGEVNAVCAMIDLLHETLQTAFNYEIKSENPKSLDSESKNWEIPLIVTVTTNENMSFCADYFIKTLTSAALTSEELESYKSLNKEVFTVYVANNYINKTFYFRKKESVDCLKKLTSNWENYLRNFVVSNGINKSSNYGKVNAPIFSQVANSTLYIWFLSAYKTAGVFSWNDILTLNEIEQLSVYKVSSTKFKL